MTTYLPEDSGIDVPVLSKIFDDKTNSYKFYWFLAILDSLQKDGNPRIDRHELAMRMIARVWYPLDYFKLSFGVQDKFRENVNAVFSQLGITTENDLLKLLGYSANEWVAPVQFHLDKILRYVPYRFVRPFFELSLRGLPDGEVDKAIISLANQSTVAPYRFDGNFIEIHEVWLRYFRQHQLILRGFTNWHLLQYLQKNNPNVPAISEKLERPIDRNFKVANPFWKTYLAQHPDLTCIYSGQPITIANFSLDHYLPFSFVAHDHLWNLIPTTKRVNSAKNDWLPDTAKYFEGFARLQFDAFQFHAEIGPAKRLEDYTLLFRESTETIQHSSFDWFRDKLSQAILPQLQTAQNMGFSGPFTYQFS